MRFEDQVTNQVIRLQLTAGAARRIQAPVPLWCAVIRLDARPGSPYALNLTRLGYAAEKISAASDEVVDAIIAWGNPERIAVRSSAVLPLAPG